MRETTFAHIPGHSIFVSYTRKRERERERERGRGGGGLQSTIECHVNEHTVNTTRGMSHLEITGRNIGQRCWRDASISKSRFLAPDAGEGAGNMEDPRIERATKIQLPA